MAAAGSYMCECGTRLTIVTESLQSRDDTVIPCPNPACKIQHNVAGQVLQVMILREDGSSVRYGLDARATACGLTRLTSSRLHSANLSDVRWVLPRCGHGTH
jgi:hypothetical protein